MDLEWGFWLGHLHLKSGGAILKAGAPDFCCGSRRVFDHLKIRGARFTLWIPQGFRWTLTMFVAFELKGARAFMCMSQEWEPPKYLATEKSMQRSKDNWTNAPWTL